MRRARAAALLLLAAGCATPAGPPGGRPLQAGDPRPAALLEALEAESQTRRALRAVARLAIDAPEGSTRSKERLVLERPSRLRVEVLAFLDQVVAVLVTDGTRFQLFRAQERRIDTGQVHAGILWEVARIALSPEEAVGVVLAAPDVAADLAVAGAEELPDGGVRIVLADPAETARRELVFDAVSRLRELTELDGAGAVAYRARYDDWREVEGGRFPFRQELQFPGGDAEALLTFQSVVLNPQLPPEIFELHLLGATPGASSR